MNMKSSLFQFFFLDMRSTGAAEGIDGKKKILKKFYVGTIVVTGAVCRVLLMLFSVVQIVVRNSTLFRIFSEHRIFRNKYYKWHTVQFEFFGTVVSLRLEVSVYSI